MKLVTVSHKAAEYYRLNVKDNHYASDELISRKLTRNIQLVTRFEQTQFKQRLIYKYGNLDICLHTKLNKVMWIKNHKGIPCEWFIKDEEKYHQLNEEYGINELEYLDLAQYNYEMGHKANIAKVKDGLIEILSHVRSSNSQTIKGFYDNKYFKLIISKKKQFFTKGSELTIQEMNEVLNFNVKNQVYA